MRTYPLPCHLHFLYRSPVWFSICRMYLRHYMSGLRLNRCGEVSLLSQIDGMAPGALIKVNCLILVHAVSCLFMQFCFVHTSACLLRHAVTLVSSLQSFPPFVCAVLLAGISLIHSDKQCLFGCRMLSDGSPALYCLRFNQEVIAGQARSHELLSWYRSMPTDVFPKLLSNFAA